MLLYQFQRYLDRHYAPDSFSLVGNTFYNNLPGEDAIFGLKGFDQFLFRREEAHGSLFLSILNDLNTMLGLRLSERELSETHPMGIPRLANTDVYFLMSQILEGVFEIINSTPQPFFSYIHLLPPHSPYMPSSQFLDAFDDGWNPPQKKNHKLGTRVPEEKINFLRQRYDEFIANLDYEFGRLLERLEKGGFLQNSYVILTSDHGEMFERGTHGHSTPLLFEPVIRIPLVISAPGQSERKEVHDLTSNVDILPTIAHLTGLPEPEWSEGIKLPGLGGVSDSERQAWILEAKKNQTRGPLNKATIALIRGNYKLVYYHGYKHYQGKYEFYDLHNDPQELENLFNSHPAAKEMKPELDAKFATASQPLD
jgi:arylsulfatase A-like enzyme